MKKIYYIRLNAQQETSAPHSKATHFLIINVKASQRSLLIFGETFLKVYRYTSYFLRTIFAIYKSLMVIQIFFVVAFIIFI